MNVELIYFKMTGKYYCSGNYETKLKYLHEIWDEVKSMNENKNLPGLVGGFTSDFIILVNVPGHMHEHPHLII